MVSPIVVGGGALLVVILGLAAAVAEEDESGAGSTPTTTSKATGTVDFFNETGGYGYIETAASEEDVFFHMDDIGGRDLREGQRVAFDIVPSDKGPRAQNVDRL